MAGFPILIVAKDAAWSRLLAWRMKVFDYYDWDAVESPFDLSVVEREPATIVIRFADGQFAHHESVRILRSQWPRADIFTTTDSNYPEDWLDAHAAGAFACIPEPEDINTVAMLADLPSREEEGTWPLAATLFLFSAAWEMIARKKRVARLTPPGESGQVVEPEKLQRWIKPTLVAEDERLLMSVFGRVKEIPWELGWAETAQALGMERDSLIEAVQRIKNVAYRWSEQRQLTPKDLEALFWAYQGFQYQKIAAKVSPRVAATTIRDRMTDIRIKLNCEVPEKLLTIARERGYISLARQVWSGETV